MTEAEAEMYRRIESYPFDAPGATYTFAHRLARENQWSPAFVDRAIAEYRRFAFLFAVAGHPVSPPDAIDHVWHLHLLYTKSYWRDFCQDILGKPLHHEPGTGAAAERAKFDDWYASTLTSYRRFFGEPPSDIWPDAVSKKLESRRYHRVDPSRDWVVSRQTLRSFVRGMAAVLLIGFVSLAAGCDEASIKAWNPLDFKGPTLLLFFFIAELAALALAWAIRSSVEEASEVAMVPGDLEPYEVACLHGGPKLVVHTAIAALCDRGWVKASGDGKLRRLKQEPALKAADMHPMEWAVFGAVGGGRPGVGRVVEKAAPEAASLGERLQRAGLVVGDSRNRWTIVRCLVIALLVPAIGFAKDYVGMQREKPVGFLILACFVSIAAGIYLFARRVHRTRKGTAVLGLLRGEHRELRKAGGWLEGQLPMAVALWGVAILAGSEWSPLRAALAYKPPGMSGGWSDGCGGSSCGGSGCGGGGGGGGCGGCSS